MKTNAIRECIQTQRGNEIYKEAREELNALLDRIKQLETTPNSCDHSEAKETDDVCPSCMKWIG